MHSLKFVIICVYVFSNFTALYKYKQSAKRLHLFLYNENILKNNNIFYDHFIVFGKNIFT